VLAHGHGKVVRRGFRGGAVAERIARDSGC
jgi:hypothetical protein